MNLFEALKARADGWINEYLGFGTSRDKTEATKFRGKVRIDDQTLQDSYNQSALVALVCNIFPKEMLREGYDLIHPEKDKIAKRAKFLGLDQYLEDGMTWGRTFGGAVLRLGVWDGREPDQPLNMQTIERLDFFDLYDRRRAWPWKYYDDPRHPRFGHPEIYLLQSLQGGSVYVHESRCVIFRGAHTDDYTRRFLNNWDLSVLDRTLDAIEAFEETAHAMRLMATDASQGVFRLKGLFAMLTGGQTNLLRERATLLDMSRSVGRVIMLDADEEEDFKKVATEFSGIGDVMTHSANILSAKTRIPVSLLMGQAPAGLNATGDAELRRFYDDIKGMQTRDLEPHLSRILSIVAITLRLDPEVGIKFRSLWQETPSETADKRLKVAQADQVYLQNGVLEPEEVAASRFTEDGWSPETHLHPGLDRSIIPVPSQQAAPQPPPNRAFGGTPDVDKNPPPGAPATAQPNAQPTVSGRAGNG